MRWVASALMASLPVVSRPLRVSIAPQIVATSAQPVENPPLPSLCLWRRFFLQGFQICEVSLAERTPDHVQVKINVLLPAVVEDLEEEAAELFPRGAAEALAPPGCAERVFATLALLEQAVQHPP